MPEENIRPWGRYDIVGKTKVISVNPNEGFSLQYHQRRDEFWRVLSGSGRVTIGEETYDAKEGDAYQIPKGTIHRMEAGPEGISFLEIATGNVDEDDIVRLEDKYGRKSPNNNNS